MSEKWWDMTDDELDDLFREASDKVEIPFDSSALDKLRQKIDFKSMPESELSRGFKKRWIALAGLLLFVGIALLYTFLNKSVESKVHSRSFTKVEHKKELRVLGNNQKLEVFIDKNNFLKANRLPTNSTHANIVENKVIQHKLLATLKKITNLDRDKLSERSGKKLAFPLSDTSSNLEKINTLSATNLLRYESLNIFNKKSVNEKIQDLSRELHETDSTNIRQKNNNGEVHSSVLSYTSKSNRKKSKLTNSSFNNNRLNSPNIYEEINSPVSTVLIMPEDKSKEESTIIRTNFHKIDFLINKEAKPLQINVESEPPTYVNAPPNTIKQPKFSRFGIRLAMAPEINSIERMESSAVVGSMFAFLLEYRLTKRLILQSGVNYSKKHYTGDFEYYRAWTSGTGTKPLTVNGTCSVADIPINLRLNAFQMNHNTFFINGGISSYLISDEIYSYNYAWGPSKIRDWTGSSSSFYWSSLNLSVGVERKMNKHFTLQVEPFLKTPLVGVGRGLVNLYSSGILFSTKYEF